MGSDRFALIKEILLQVLDLPEAERASYLDAACAGDAELRREIDAKLGRLETSSGIIRTDGARDALGEVGARSVPEPAAPDPAPVTIGPYTLRKKLGEGGFGEVYVAEQSEPVRRRVALKILKAGMDTKAVLARFEAERQALAVMDHPNIAKVHDAGETGRGRPYFVMELVNGEAITTYCDNHGLSTEKRLELFQTVCDAVQHAHQKGIIHRDLKPANILVSANGRPIPKVIDFGIAKATSLSLTERTLFTERGQLIGTPDYMSPEQAEMRGLDVDTRTDVYSLGVILYELLSGSLPFDPQRLRQSGIAGIQRIICEEEPPKPSTKVSTARASSETARRRGTDPVRLARKLRGDLDWIVLRAMEKERMRRYQTPTALIGDIQRYLENRPVAAGPPSGLYRLGKFARRNRAAIVVASIVLGSLCYVAFESDRQRVAAERARDESEAVTTFLSDMLAAAGPESRGRDVTVREVIAEAEEAIDEQFSGQPLIRARLMHTMGVVNRDLGLYAEARPLLEGALAIRERSSGGDDLRVAKSLCELGLLHFRNADFRGAARLYERALAIQTAKLGPDHADVARTLNDMANALRDMGNHDGARPLFERALAIREKELGPNHLDVAYNLSDLGILHALDMEYAEALRLWERTVAILDSHGVQGPSIARTLNNMGAVYMEMEEYEAALPLLERALGVHERTLGEESPEVGQTLSNLGTLHQFRGDYERSRSAFDRSLSIKRRVFGEDGLETAMTKVAFAVMLMEVGEREEARRLLEPGARIVRRELGDQHFRTGLAIFHLACLASDTGRLDRADSLFREGHEILVDALGPDHPSVQESARRHAELRRRMGKPG